MNARLLTVNNLIYAVLGFYLVAKDPLYQFQALLFQDVIFKMVYVKLSLLLLAVLIIPLCLGRFRLTGINALLLLFVVYNFCAITLINNDFPQQDRLTIFYVSMFLPLFLVVVNLFGIEPGRLPRWTKRVMSSGFVLFMLMDCLVGLWQPIRGADYYAPFYSVSLLGIIPSKVVTIKEQTRSLGFFLDGIQHGLFLNFALYFCLSLVLFRQKYRYLLLVILILANIYLTYTRSVYVFTGLSLVLLLLLVSLHRRQTILKMLLLRYFWLASLLTGVIIYIYGMLSGESDATRSLFIRFESARFILDSLTASIHKLLFGIGYIQNSELFDEFVPDNLFLAIVSSGGIIALIIFIAIFVKLNRDITRNIRPMFDDGPAFLAAYLLFVNILAFGMFCNYLDSIFMFFLFPIIYLLRHGGKSAIPKPVCGEAAHIDRYREPGLEKNP